MKIKNILPMMALTTLAACGTGQGTKLSMGIDPANLDTTAAPGTDFYRYACGGWMDSHPLSAEYSRYGSFDKLVEDCNEQLRTLIEEVAARDNEPGSVADKIARLYNSAMDSTKLNSEGIQPIRKDLGRITDCTDKQMLFQLYTQLQMQGVGGLFSVFIDADIKNSKMNLVQLYQSGLVMGQKDYYLDTDSATLAIRDAYKRYMTAYFKRCAIAPESELPQRIDNVLALETRLARVSRSRTDLRDDEKNYNKMSIGKLNEDFPGIDWGYVFGAMGANDITELSVGQPEVIHEVEAIWAETSLDVLKDYVRWQLMDAAGGSLDDETRAMQFEFWGRAMSGRQEDRPRWKRAVAVTQDALGEAIGQLYVEKHFPPAAKERMVQLVKNLQVALGERIDAQSWMSDSTKAVAHEKLDAFIVKVGYPDKWKDYSELTIGDNYWENQKNASLWAVVDMVNRKLNKPVDNTEWYMTPQTVNAYYNPTTNEICFPAGILQPPFFDMEADDAFNYGAIGVVIGHEMTHGFDDQGAKFDKDGNLRQWWTADDTKNFEERTNVMRDFFDNIEVLPGLKCNGQLTLGENMADHGGLQVAYQAFKNATKDAPLTDEGGFTPDQRFFLAYAGVWASNVRDEEIRNRTKGDPHALGRWRVNGQLPHIDAWYDAFGITESDPMFVPKAERVDIW